MKEGWMVNKSILGTLVLLMTFLVSGYAQSTGKEASDTGLEQYKSGHKGSFSVANNFNERLKEVHSFLIENDPRVKIIQKYKYLSEEILLEILKHADPLERIGALSFLDIKYSVKALKDEELAVRYFAANKLLEYLPFPEGEQFASAVKDIAINDKPTTSFRIAQVYGDVLGIKESTMMRIYNNKKAGLLRLEAFNELYTSSLSGKSDQLIRKALQDVDSKVRIAAAEIVEEEAFLYKDAEAQKILEKINGEDPVLKRYLRYIENITSYRDNNLKYMTDYRKGIIGSFPNTKEAMTVAYEALNDEDPGVRSMYAQYLWFRIPLRPDLIPIIYMGFKNDNVWVRFFTSLKLIRQEEYNDHAMEARKVYGQSLEELVNANEEETAYLVLSYQVIPLEGCPDTSILTNIFNDKRPLVRYGLLELLRTSLYSDNNPKGRVIYNKLYYSPPRPNVKEQVNQLNE